MQYSIYLSASVHTVFFGYNGYISMKLSISSESQAPSIIEL